MKNAELWDYLIDHSISPISDSNNLKVNTLYLFKGIVQCESQTFEEMDSENFPTNYSKSGLNDSLFRSVMYQLHETVSKSMDDDDDDFDSTSKKEWKDQ